MHAMAAMYGGSEYDPNDTDDDYDFRDPEQFEATRLEEEEAARKDRREEKRQRRSFRKKHGVNEKEDQGSATSDSDSSSQCSSDSSEESVHLTREQLKKQQEQIDRAHEIDRRNRELSEECTRQWFINERLKEAERERSRADDEAKRAALRAERARQKLEEFKQALAVMAERDRADDEEWRQVRRTRWRCLHCGEENHLLSGQNIKHVRPWTLRTSCMRCNTPKGEAAHYSVSEPPYVARFYANLFGS